MLLASLTAALALPGSGGADPATDAGALRAQNASLGTRIHAALLNLYSLDAQLTQSRAREAALQAQADDVRNQLVQVGRERDIAQHAWRVSVAALSSRLRTLYESGQPDAIAVLLGATSIDDALTRLDDLERVARMNRDAVVQTRHARGVLKRLQTELGRRSQRLHALVASAEQTTAQLEQTRTERSAYMATLANERAFNTRRIAQLDAAARAAARAPSAGIRQAQTASAPPTAPTVAAAPPVSAGTTLVVTATGYSLSGRTSTGLPTGWGVVAVDPSVIPFGTRLTIPGYGEGVAADTGGGVQGASIDLWFPSAAQAMAWGRRTVTITLH